MLNKIRAKISTPENAWDAYLADHWVIFFFTHNHVIQAATHAFSQF